MHSFYNFRSLDVCIHQRINRRIHDKLLYLLIILLIEIQVMMELDIWPIKNKYSENMTSSSFFLLLLNIYCAFFFCILLLDNCWSWVIANVFLFTTFAIEYSSQVQTLDEDKWNYTMIFPRKTSCMHKKRGYSTF